MPTRRKPNSATSRLKAMQAGKERKDAIPAPSVIPYSADTITRLDALYPAFKLKVEAMEAALAVQATVTVTVRNTRPVAEIYISHFYQALQNAIRRGVIPASARVSYGLSVSDSKIPKMNSEASVVFWGDKAANGEAARIAAGGAPITYPSIAEVNTAVNAFKNANQQQANAKYDFDVAQEAIEAENPEADKLILKMWNETETAFDEGDKPSMRRKAREWGIVYVPNPGEPPSPDDYSIVGTITDSTTNQPLENVLLRVQETDALYTTDADGRFFIEVLPPGNYTLLIQHTGYQNLAETNIAVTDGVLQELFLQLIPAGGFGALSGTVQQGGAGVAATITIEGTGIVVSTDPATGAYLIPNVPAGAQFMRVNLDADPTQQQGRLVEVSTGETKTEVFNFV